MATVVKCDNPNCNAHYEVSSFLGGHTFTCNKCGSRVTVRDLSVVAQGQPLPSQHHDLSNKVLIVLVLLLLTLFIAVGYYFESL